MSYNRNLRNYMSRAKGLSFEDTISSSCLTYFRNGIAKIEKQQEPMKIIRPMGSPGQFLACFTQRSGVDYKGTLKGGRAVAFEAKHTDTEKMEFKRLQTWQYDYLKEHSDLGAITFVLLSFKMQNFYRIPIGVWADMKKLYGRLYLKEEDIQEYKLKEHGLFIDFLEGFYNEKDLNPIIRL